MSCAAVQRRTTGVDNGAVGCLIVVALPAIGQRQRHTLAVIGKADPVGCQRVPHIGVGAALSAAVLHVHSPYRNRSRVIDRHRGIAACSAGGQGESSQALGERVIGRRRRCGRVVGTSRSGKADAGRVQSPTVVTAGGYRDHA